MRGSFAIRRTAKVYQICIKEDRPDFCEGLVATNPRIIDKPF